MSPKILSLNRFVARYAERRVFKNEKGETESAIVLSDKKTVCSNSEQFKFYAKIGGVLNLKDLTTQKVKDLLPKLNLPGFYIVMCTHRTAKGPDTYALVYSQINSKLLDIPISPLVSFLPRIDGTTGDVLCGLRIIPNDKIKNRQWIRYSGTTKSNYPGFVELKYGYDFDNDYRQKNHSKFGGFYVTKNCSLMVYDIGTVDPTKSVNPEQNRTLVQEGGFVYVDADVVYKLATDTEDKLLSAKELYEKFKDTEKSVLGSDKYKKGHLVRDHKEPKHRSVIHFLKPSPYCLPYELHITDDLSKDKEFKGKRIAVLFIPKDAEFEYCEYWELLDGCQSVKKRQKSEPWHKYLQKESDAQNILFEDKINDIPILSYPVETRTEKSPQSEELFKFIKKARKGQTCGPSKTPEQAGGPPPAKTSEQPAGPTAGQSPGQTTGETTGQTTDEKEKSDSAKEKAGSTKEKSDSAKEKNDTTKEKSDSSKESKKKEQKAETPPAGGQQTGETGGQTEEKKSIDDKP